MRGGLQFLGQTADLSRSINIERTKKRDSPRLIFPYHLDNLMRKMAFGMKGQQEPLADGLLEGQFHTSTFQAGDHHAFKDIALGKEEYNNNRQGGENSSRHDRRPLLHRKVDIV